MLNHLFKKMTSSQRPVQYSLNLKTSLFKLNYITCNDFMRLHILTKKAEKSGGTKNKL